MSDVMHAQSRYRSRMIRTRIRLDLNQHARLEALAARQSKSVAQLTREGVNHVLAAERRATAWNRFMAAADACRTNDLATDVSVRHDAYLEMSEQPDGRTPWT